MFLTRLLNFIRLRWFSSVNDLHYDQSKEYLECDYDYDRTLLHEQTKRKDSLRTIERYALETQFFHENEIQESNSSYHSHESEFKYDMMNNVCVCMVDIVGFSTWCSNHLPNIIARAMVEYNEWIVNLINNYSGIKKIELVGDCCMIVSGTEHEKHESLTNSYLSMIRLAVDMLEDIDVLKNVFKSKNIGIRIGIHVSDVIGIYLTNPHKYQMFGNDINVCSRLESSAISNTIHVSEKTLMCVQNVCKNICGPCCRCIKGTAINQCYKGIGFKTSYQLFLKKKQFYLVNFNSYFYKRLKDTYPHYEFTTDNDETVILDATRSFKYNAVIVNISKKRAIHDFKVIEIIDSLKSISFFTQNCILLTDSTHYQQAFIDHEYEFENIVNFDSKDFYDKLGILLMKFTQEFSNTKRGSLDLSLAKDMRYA